MSDQPKLFAAHERDPMTLHHGESCLPCILKHIGPALEKILYALGSRDQYCGGCGRTTMKYKFTYWFPWPDEEPERPDSMDAAQWHSGTTGVSQTC